LAQIAKINDYVWWRRSLKFSWKFFFPFDFLWAEFAHPRGQSISPLKGISETGRVTRWVRQKCSTGHFLSKWLRNFFPRKKDTPQFGLIL
jgi:hypothetical protein